MSSTCTIAAPPHSAVLAAPSHVRPDPQGDPATHLAELVQRGRLVLDVTAADLEASDARLGAFHPTSLFFRQTAEEARRAWDRLVIVHGSRAVEAALAGPPHAVLTLGHDAAQAVLIVIQGRTYRVEPLPGTPEAPAIHRLTRLPPLEDGPYYACRLADGSLQCDCAQWTFQDADAGGPVPCKHLDALRFLGWI